MDFARDNSSKQIAHIFGFISAYVIFTACLYFMITFVKKETIPLLHVIAASSVITIAGILTKKYLK